MQERGSRRLQGKVALITGATQNLGRGAAECFAAAGADLVLLTRSSAEASRRLASELAVSNGVRAVSVQGDIGSREDIARAVAEGIDVMGRIDIALECAAVRPHTPFLEMEWEEWDEVVRTNLGSAFLFAKAVVPGMVERKWGRVIHVSGQDGWTGYPNRVHNVAAKAGLHGFTKGLAREVTQFGVTVNTVVPGVFATTRDPEKYPNWSDERKARDVPLGRLGTAREFGMACVFVADPDSEYMTGQAIHLNGGEYMF